MDDPDQLEQELSIPPPEVVADLRSLPGDILILGAGGKLGPSLAHQAVRAIREAGTGRRVWGASRFRDESVRRRLEDWGVTTIRADLLEASGLGELPECSNVILLAGHKFGSATDPATTWATNVTLPGMIARRFSGSRIVAFSTGNVYPLWPVSSRGPTEDDRTDPVGEYARSAVGRERVLSYLSATRGTPMALLRLNYAIEPRYGVLHDIAVAVRSGQPIDLAMGHVNVIWQRDANAVALRSLAHCSTPPLVLNVTGPETVSVRAVALEFGRMFGLEPGFVGVESDHALLSDATRCRRMFGPPSMSVPEMIERVGRWLLAGGRSLGKPTGFGEREGRF